MRVSDKVLTGVAIGLLLIGLFYLSVPQVLHRPSGDEAADRGERSDEGPPVAAGERAAEFKLQDLNGDTVTLSSLRGKVVFLNIWATWCGPCREEMPSMETLYNDFKNNKDFVILAVSQDRLGKDAVKSYVEKNGYHFRVLLDPQNKLSESYDLSGVPETFIIDRHGRIVAHHMGAFDWSRSDVLESLQQLLEAKDV
jgi:cytochrome c biogenesis protein CcmG, thiol:disulfide interchange protein DsbE